MVNEDIFYNVEFGEVEEVTYESVDGKKVQGWIVKPPGFDLNKSTLSYFEFMVDLIACIM